MRISLRELLIVVAFVAVGCAAMTYANDGWWIAVATFTFLVTLACVIVSVVDHAARRAFAIGFLICCIGYFGIVRLQKSTNGANYEYFPNSVGKLPSTELLSRWYSAVVTQSVDPATNKKVFTPPGRSFMRIGHTLVMLLLGYVGGLFARFVYHRRQRESKPTPDDTS